MRTPAAYLFDMDGTLCDTEPLHFRALQQVLTENGQALDIRAFETQIAGQTTPAVFRTLFPDLEDQARDQLIRRKETLFREMAGELLPTAGVVELLDRLKAIGTAIALVTNAPRMDVDFILDVLGLSDRFPMRIIAAELTHPKPHPLPYRRALALCNVKAGAAVAFEDSNAGVLSATTAGITTIGITTTLTADALRRAGASATIKDFTDARLSSLRLLPRWSLRT